MGGKAMGQAFAFGVSGAACLADFPIAPARCPGGGRAGAG